VWIAVTREAIVEIEILSRFPFGCIGFKPSSTLIEILDSIWKPEKVRKAA
jgi:hypothetical protein